jgi:hypothetical protein
MKRNPNMLYFLLWLWNWTRIWKTNGESSWFFKLGFRFEFSLDFFEVFTSIHRLFSILSLRWWFKVQTRGFFWIYLDLVEIRTEILEKVSDPSSSHSFRPCDHVNPLDDEGSCEEPLRTSKKNPIRNDFCCVITGLRLVLRNWWELVVIWCGFCSGLVRIWIFWTVRVWRWWTCSSLFLSFSGFLESFDRKVWERESENVFVLSCKRMNGISLTRDELAGIYRPACKILIQWALDTCTGP